jgi:rubredoxin
MVRYYCNCCGCYFSEEEGKIVHSEEIEIRCPMCGANYDEEDTDERVVERDIV